MTSFAYWIAVVGSKKDAPTYANESAKEALAVEALPKLELEGTELR